MKSVIIYIRQKRRGLEEIFEEYKIELVKKPHTLDVYRAMGALVNIEFLIFKTISRARKFHF